MTRRVTIPEDHVALILPNQLADELSSLAMEARNQHLATYRRDRGAKLEETGRQQRANEAKQRAEIYGELLLALLEAREA